VTSKTDLAAERASDDYPLERVPERARYWWVTVAVQRFGQMSSLAQFLLGATLGFGMTFGDSVLAITLGAVILEVVAIAVGIAGMREGLSTSVLARWTGFGARGSALLGLVIAGSATGWFGIQNQVFAQGLRNLIGGPPLWVWALITGAAVTAIVIYGFASMSWTAYITVPAFVVLVAWSVTVVLSRHSLSELVNSPPPGPHLSLAAGATIVAGGFIVGSVIAPDMTRYNRSVADVVKQTVIGMTLGEYVVGLAGVLLAHAVKTSDVAGIVASSSGVVGTIILIAATLKINDWNLYSSSLGIVNIVHSVFRVRLNRAATTAVVGAVGTVLSAVGVLSHFTGFLIVLGVAIPPVSGIIIAEYFVVRRWGPALTESRLANRLPAAAPAWVPATLVVWLGAFLVGHYVNWGIPSINSLVVAVVAYLMLARLGLTAGVGSMRTDETADEAGAGTPAQTIATTPAQAAVPQEDAR
jgi:cytosine permease